eukprot:350235-Chlamydomonas_euryale.AAC.9
MNSTSPSRLYRAVADRPALGRASQGRVRQSVQARAARYDRRKPPPPDLPSMLFDNRIVYLGMPVSRCSAGSWASGPERHTAIALLSPPRRPAGHACGPGVTQASPKTNA